MATAAQPVIPGHSVARVSAAPEMTLALLLACCSAHAEEKLPWICRKFDDWPRLMELARQHGVLPQVHKTLANQVLPAAIRENFHASYQSHVRRAVLLTGELIAVLERLQAEGLPVLPYKGAVLAEMLYGDVAARQYGDIDLIVPSRDVARAADTLQDLGYTPGLRLTAAQQSAYLKSGYEYTFDSARGRNVVEIQWNVLPHFYCVDFDVERFFRDAKLVNFQGRTVTTLAPETLLLVLAVHAAKHAWEKLGWLCDLVQLMKTQELDWQAVRAESRRLGVERILAVNFLLAQSLLGADIPEGISIDLAAQAIAQEVAEQMKRGESYHTESINYFRLMLRLRERWSDRCRFLWRLASTPSTGEWAAVRLPERLSPLSYRGVRVARLLRRLAALG
jgi:hypothetical protein